MHKILTINKDEEKIYVEVEGIDTKFVFNLGDIKEKADLKTKIKYSVKCYISNKALEDANDLKYNELKTLEGTDAAN